MDKETRQTVIQLAAVSSIGIAMVLAIFGCFFVGRWLDRLLETDSYLTLLFLLIGIAAGFRNMYVLTKRYLKNEKPTDLQEKREHPGKGPSPKKT